MFKLSQTSKMDVPSISFNAVECCPRGCKLAHIKGSTCNACYARKGSYRYSNVVELRDKNLEYYLNTDTETIINETVELISSNPAVQKHKKFRWFDSGDIYDKYMLSIIVIIAKKLPDIQFWVPTHEIDIVKDYILMTPEKPYYGEYPANLNIRISKDMIDETMDKNDWKLFEEFGITFSGVKQNKTDMGGHICTAKKCNGCSICWNRKIPFVAYKKH